MSKQLINKYYNEVHQARRAGATTEGALSPYFHTLVTGYAMSRKYLFLREITIKSKKTGKNIRPDGILMNDLRVHRGYWESKDEHDDIDTEIHKKINDKGYPVSNILFDDTQTAVLIQGGEEVVRCEVSDTEQLHKILSAFINYKPAEVVEFEAALEEFKKDIPQIVSHFRELFDEKSKTNAKYRQARDRFLELCKSEINPDITTADIREMLIQHILTEDLFTAIFDDSSFLKYNIIARELEDLINTVLTREVRQNQLGDIRHYYKTLNATAASIADHNEKQKFLKIVYENFYKVYNPKGADRLGVVYTPNEIVRFMVQSTDHLLEKHFNTNLHEKGVEILDPATGTGTYITDIIDYIAPQYLPYKYQNELHANEVSILPYYIANLNIEYTYKNKMGNYTEFKNICFVDTLDNTDALAYKGKQQSLFGLSSENSERIQRQNKRKISVIIGNPPYNAKQANFNDFNKNRVYPQIDKRIKETFIKEGTAQNQIVVYDMYTRFYRWAMDRINKTQGVICMITNNSFVNSRTFDGFRKCIQDEFDYAYIVDLGGNIRELSGKDGIFLGEAHTVFGLGAMVGIAILFLVKSEHKDGKKPCQINYIHPCDIRATRIEKFEWIKSHPFKSIPFERVTPSKKNYWINLSDNDFDELIPVMDKKVKSGKSKEAIFKLFSRGVATQRDQWVYDFDKNRLTNKVKFMIDIYQKTLKNKDFEDKMLIKWDSDLNTYLKRSIEKSFHEEQVLRASYRPFTKKYFYFDRHFNGRTYQWFDIYNGDEEQKVIVIPGLASPKEFHSYVIDAIIDLNALPAGCQCLPLYRYDSDGTRHDNLTDWGLQQFKTHYQDDSITKESIFHYTYSVLHHPAYRSKYALNLKREFPRLPFYADFHKWSDIGKTLMNLHLHYETTVPTTLAVVEAPVPTTSAVAPVQTTLAVSETAKRVSLPAPKPKLKADKEANTITLDSQTTLTGIPALAWQYKLGNRSALEWILDQYKEKKPRDATIAEKFNTYRFADYKEEVIDLLCRVCTVSVRTMEIINEMPDGGDGDG